jgi:peptidoglycan/LPS O-acetylase OafA/YrhL
MYLTGFRNEFFRPLLWGAPAAMLVAGAVAMEQGWRLKVPTPFVRLGDASYAIYLCHMPVTAVVAHTLGPHSAAFFVCVAVLASTTAGVLFHLFVEKPLIAVFRAIPGRLAAIFTAARPRGA